MKKITNFAEQFAPEIYSTGSTLIKKLSTDNSFEMAQMLYAKKDVDGLTRHFDKMLEARVKEFKADNFELVQTPINEINAKAQTVEERGYNVPVSYASEILDFYAYVHTPEANFASDGATSRKRKFANFNIFKNKIDDKVICTSYIGAGKYGTAQAHGFIMKVQKGKQYVARGYDIYSLSKNIPDMLMEYYQGNKIYGPNGRGENAEHRQFVSKQLKDILKISDEEYISRMDRIKSDSQGEQLTLAEIRRIDPDMAKAYETLLSRDNTGESKGARCIIEK